MLNETHLFTLFDELDIHHHTIAHAPLFSVSDSDGFEKPIGAHVKNLFLRDKKKTNYWLVTILEHKQADLKSWRSILNAQGNLSFANEEILYELLGVKPGSVTIFGLINDIHRRVIPYIDREIFNFEIFHAHPLRNDRTSAISTEDLKKFVTHLQYPLNLL